MCSFDRENLVKKVTSERNSEVGTHFPSSHSHLPPRLLLILFARLLPCFVTAEEHCILTLYFSVLCAHMLLAMYTYSL